MKTLKTFESFSVNESFDILSIVSNFKKLKDKLSDIFSIFNKEKLLSKVTSIIEKSLGGDYSAESIRRTCDELNIKFDWFQKLYGVHEEFGFKKSLVLMVLSALFLFGCVSKKDLSEQTIILKNEKLVDVDWKYGPQLWTLTRPMTESDTCRTYKYKNGDNVITIIEERDWIIINPNTMDDNDIISIYDKINKYEGDEKNARLASGWKDFRFHRLPKEIKNKLK